MRKVLYVGLVSIFLLTTEARCQLERLSKDTTINNLVLPIDYTTSEYGSIPKFRKIGRGKQSMILIPGLGFDDTVYDDFVSIYAKQYTCYVTCVPGFGSTHAAALPPNGTSYGDQYWNNGVLIGIINLIKKEHIQKPVIVGSFVQGVQLALRLAIDYPDNVARVIVMGGAAKFVFMNKGIPTVFPLPALIKYTDKQTRYQWFQRMPSSEFIDGNYRPEIYSLDSAKGTLLWTQVAKVPTPVMVEYLCEFIASDVTLEVDKIKCPVLVLRPRFSDLVLSETINNYVKPQFIDAWEGLQTKNPLVKVVDISNAASFVWKDNPLDAYSAIDLFLKM